MRVSRIRSAGVLLGLASGLAPTTSVQAYPSGDYWVAKTLWQEAKARGASDKVILAMFEAAVTESGMRNLPYGHWDSRGVFQIRTSIWGWSTATNVSLSARWFLNRAIPRQYWYGTAGALAQAVEVSSYPWKYNGNQWWAQSWINAVRGTATSGATSSGASWVMLQVKITGTGVNVRAGPGTGYARVGGLNLNDIVNVYGVSGGSSTALTASWYKIWYGGAWRWVIAQYTAKVGMHAKVNSGDGVNVRSGPGTGYARVGGLNNGSVVHVFAMSNGWYKIWFNGAWRWILGQYTVRV